MFTLMPDGERSERNLLDEYLAELDAEFGPAPEDSVAEVDDLWPSQHSAAAGHSNVAHCDI